MHDAFCPTCEHAARIFRLREGFDDPIFGRDLGFTRSWGIEVARFEFIEDATGRTVTYDVNKNTNYNTAVNPRGGRPRAAEIARFLGRLPAEGSRADEEQLQLDDAVVVGG